LKDTKNSIFDINDCIKNIFEIKPQEISKDLIVHELFENLNMGILEGDLANIEE
jgi:hypothetical protein